MSDKAYVTVIIPTYNRANYINRAIDSVLNQTYKAIEIIVVDDNGDNTPMQLEMIKKMERYKDNKNVIYIKHKTNKNGAAARNTGISLAKGKYITFLDDDDYYLPTRIENLVNLMEERKEYDAAYTSMVVVCNKKIIEYKKANLEGNLQKEMLKQKSFFGTGSNMIFTAKSLKSIGGFDEQFRRNQDLEVFVRFFRKYKIAALDKILVIKNVDDRSNLKTFDLIYNSKIKYLEVFKNDIEKYTEPIQKDIYLSNYYELVRFSAKYKNKLLNLKRIIKSTKDNNININLKFIIITFVYYINGWIHLKQGFDLIKSKFKKNTYDQDLLNFIEEMEQ